MQDEEKMVRLLESLLQSCLILNSEQRFTPEQVMFEFYLSATHYCLRHSSMTLLRQKSNE